MNGIKILSASAGSGKTYSLAYDYVRNVVAQPDMYRKILAVTFTNKATEEMKSRIVARICEIASGAPSPYMKDLKCELGMSEDKIRAAAKVAEEYILHDYSHFTVVTIDKFFQRIIRSFIRELGIELNFNLELKSESLIENATDNLIERIADDEQLRRWIVDFARSRIEQNKGWDVRRSLAELGKEIFREGVAIDNTLSREELEAQMNALVKQSELISKKIVAHATQAMSIIDDAGLWVEDFAYGRTGVAGFMARVAGGDLAPYKKRVTDALADKTRWAPKKGNTAAVNSIVDKLHALLEQICSEMDTNSSYIISVELLRENFRGFALLRDLKSEIDAICASENIMPISQTNKILGALIEGNDTPFIFEKSGNHFTRYMIDEFQDTSRLQWNNFVPLIENAIAQSATPAVLLVGDIKQSIYRWRGGDWKIMANDVAESFPTEIVPLESNFRSAANIVAFNNNIIRRCVDADNESLNTKLDEAAVSAEFMRKHRNLLSGAYTHLEQRSNDTSDSGYVTVTSYDNKDSESQGIMPPIIERIEDLQRRGYAPGQIAIVVRLNAQAVEISNHLLEYKATHPTSPFSFDVVTQEALIIGNSPVVRFVIAAFELSANQHNTLALGIYNNFLSRSVDAPLQDEEFIASLESMPPAEAFERVVYRFALDSASTNIAYLQALSDQILNFCSGYIADLQLFVKWWNESGHAEAMQMPRQSNAITVTTIHKAKGLEYDAVIIPYCTWDLMPSSRTTLWAHSDDERLSEMPRMPIKYKLGCADSLFAQDYLHELIMSHIDNINTLYVALTRPRSELHIMMPTQSKKSDRVSSLIRESITIDGEKAATGGLMGRIIKEQTKEIIEFGAPAPAPKREAQPSSVAAVLPCKPRENLRLSLGSRRDAVADETLDSPRSSGVLLHKIFEQAASTQDMYNRIASLHDDGIISLSESKELGEKLDKALQNSLARSWFDEPWDDVRTESDIITPGDRHIKRPDRVMISGTRAVVVDYKFGSEQRPSHKKQMSHYVRLLSRMGYSDVKGYLWYVWLDKIENI